ncbi:MAG TPA: protein-glutamine glutaminase family protein [Thermoanaerobaculia bacterium]|jgi:hypothetical protein
MADVSFIEPGDELPAPAKEDAYFFHPSARANFLSQIENLARQRGRHLFVAKEQERLVSVGVTKVRKVLAVFENGVRLSNSHARHRVDPEVEPLTKGRWYELAIDPASNGILKANPITPEPEVAQVTSLFSIQPVQDLAPVSLDEAEMFFSRVRRQPHIPFQHPSNGCWARAHEMTRLIEHHFDRDPRAVVAKIWNFGDLTVHTDNSPTCAVDWIYHVAPVVRTGDGPDDMLVIDPALFEQPVKITEWRSRQADSLQKPEDPLFTSQEAYNLADDAERGTRSFIGEDPGATEEQLGIFWGELISSVLANGPLPYRCAY